MAVGASPRHRIDDGAQRTLTGGRLDEAHDDVGHPLRIRCIGACEHLFEPTPELLRRIRQFAMAGETPNHPPTLLNPTLLIEITSDSTRNRDTIDKLDAYFQLGGLHE